MLVYIDDREDKEFYEHREYAYVYIYDDYDYEEDSEEESNSYEIDYEVRDDDYLVS